MKRFGWQTTPWALVLLALGFSAFSSSAQAQQGKPDGGFSGFVSVLLGVAEVESQFQTDDDNRVNTSLSSSGESSTVFTPAVPFELAYMVSDWNTQFYAGIPVENLREGAFFQWEAGARYWLADNTRLSASLIAPSLIVDETWSDPFLLNAPRSKTEKPRAPGPRARTSGSRASGNAGAHCRVRLSQRLQVLQPGPGAGASVGGFTLSTTDLKIPGAWIYPSSGARCRLPAPDGHCLSPLRDLIAA